MYLRAHSGFTYAREAKTKHVTMCWTEDRDGVVFDMEDTRRDLGQHYRSVD